jgi:hypothetical protein
MKNPAGRAGLAVDLERLEDLIRNDHARPRRQETVLILLSGLGHASHAAP